MFYHVLISSARLSTARCIGMRAVRLGPMLSQLGKFSDDISEPSRMITSLSSSRMKWSSGKKVTFRSLQSRSTGISSVWGC
ncbi:hypothetical protein E4U16_006105 [Claviceps sp. LM84 group G4]|nr:hypothetical protein E4U16_006105 [Claviceps sp. LM84 group G4]